MPNDTYYFGLLVLVFGGFLALNSTGAFAGIGIWGMVLGTLVGVIGLLRSGIDRPQSGS